MAGPALAHAARTVKRFYQAASASGEGAVLLDGRPVRTPARLPLVLPTPALAAAIAGEWNAQGASIEPGTMPLTGLANAAIDRVAPDRERFARDLAAYAETDLLCYRAAESAALAERQAVVWDPLLAWARSRYDVAFAIVEGIVHRAQPPATVSRLAVAVRALDAFALAGLSPLVTIGGSLVLGLAVVEQAVATEAAFDAAELDGDWQASHWGADPLAQSARADRWTAFHAAARFLELLR